MAEHEMSVSVGPKGCAGCLITILVVIGFWALIFGVTIDGKHYGLSCSKKDGVTIGADKR